MKRVNDGQGPGDVVGKRQREDAFGYEWALGVGKFELRLLIPNKVFPNRSHRLYQC